jgi:glucose/arabinose dehydrogenase
MQLILAALVLLLLFVSRVDACDGDCNGDGMVTVDEPGVAAATVLVTAALEHPVHITAPHLDQHRIFVVEQAGRIRIVKDGALLADPFLAIESRVSSSSQERGLLSLAFHPDFASNGRFFVDYTDTAGNTVVARYQVGRDADHADPASEHILLTIEQPFDNHNGGQLAFGPEGDLYVGMGDGGSEGDPLNTGQRDDTLLGKLLRIDVDVEDPPYHAVPADNPHAERGDPLGLVWAKGLRNPWRFSFDRLTGDLYIADVGQDRLEEIDVQPAASHGGENYGWRLFEADACYDPSPAATCPNPPDGFTFPVSQYTHAVGCSVTGGFVYRGCALPDLRGQYFFSDYCTAFLKTFTLVGGVATNQQDRTTALAPGGGHTIDSVVSFGEDARGELYIADYDGEIYEIVPASE